jgi:hypothetical protein
VSVSVNRKTIMLHKLIGTVFIPNPDGKPVIDHIDGDATNNNVSNLRWATRQENQRNRGLSKKTSGLPRGVRPNNQRYIAKIKIESKYIYLGTYDTPEEASVVYEARAREAFGEFYRPIPVQPVQETA